MGSRGSRRPRTRGMRDGAAIKANRRTPRRAAPLACVRSVGGCVCWCGDTAPPGESRARDQARLPMDLPSMDLRSFTQSNMGHTRLHWTGRLFRRRGRSLDGGTVAGCGGTSDGSAARLYLPAQGPAARLHDRSGAEVGGQRLLFREAARARTSRSHYSMQASLPSRTPARHRPLGGARVANRNPCYVAPAVALPQNSIIWQWRGRAAVGEGVLLWTFSLRRQLDCTGRQRRAAAPAAAAPAAAAHHVLLLFCWFFFDACSLC